MQGLSEKFGDPGKIFIWGPYIFPKMLASVGGGGGEYKNFNGHLQKRSKKIFYTIIYIKNVPHNFF